jgi:3-deoxy-D-manno-octulosonic-acid transferase
LLLDWYSYCCFFVSLIGAIIISVWWDKIKQQKKRKARRKRYFKKYQHSYSQDQRIGTHTPQMNALVVVLSI